MSTHTNHSDINVTYFCTITCYRWLPLFEEAKGYDQVYKWFAHLLKDGCYILGYVIMPNHLHCLLFPTSPKKQLNSLVAEGKRFMAYGLVSGLKANNQIGTLKNLERGVQPNERSKGKRHQVFRLSFDARVCSEETILEQKLDYIHHNPVMGKWCLVDDFTQYPHSSAGYYEKGLTNEYLTHYKDVASYSPP